MEIKRQTAGNELHLAVSGRIDGTWAGTLDRELSDAIGGGAHHIRLDLRSVSFISSAGIRVFLKTLKLLASVHGSLAVTDASESVRTVIDLTGLTRALAQSGPSRAAPRSSGAEVIAHEAMQLELYRLTAPPPVELVLHGHPGLPGEGAGRAFKIALEPGVLAIGTGAFGDGSEAGGLRYGECLAVCGAAACLPAEKAAAADFLVATPKFVPAVNFMYAMSWTAGFSGLLRFESRLPGGGMGLSELLDIAIRVAGRGLISAVILAETTGLVGIALRRQPAAGAGNIYDYPEIKKWFLFTPEPVFGRALAFGAGIAASAPEPALMPWLRPAGRDGRIQAHFHSAVFDRRPLKRGMLELGAAAQDIFGNETLRGVMHLANDSRELSGAGESRFARGAVWFGPVEKVTAG